MLQTPSAYPHEKMWCFKFWIVRPMLNSAKNAKKLRNRRWESNRGIIGRTQILSSVFQWYRNGLSFWYQILIYVNRSEIMCFIHNAQQNEKHHSWQYATTSLKGFLLVCKKLRLQPFNWPSQLHIHSFAHNSCGCTVRRCPTPTHHGQPPSPVSAWSPCSRSWQPRHWSTPSGILPPGGEEGSPDWTVGIEPFNLTWFTYTQYPL